MYIKSNDFRVSSFPISLYFVRLIPKKFYIYRGINLRNSTVTEKSCYISSILMQIYHILSKNSTFCPLNLNLIWGIISLKGYYFPFGDWSQHVQWSLRYTTLEISSYKRQSLRMACLWAKILQIWSNNNKDPYICW